MRDLQLDLDVIMQICNFLERGLDVFEEALTLFELARDEHLLSDHRLLVGELGREHLQVYFLFEQQRELDKQSRHSLEVSLGFDIVQGGFELQ